VPRKVDDDGLQEPPRRSLRRSAPSGMDDPAAAGSWLYDRRKLAEARQDLAAWITKWQGKYPKLTDWVEENIEETMTFY
jgi:transposase-like protein